MTKELTSWIIAALALVTLATGTMAITQTVRLANAKTAHAQAGQQYAERIATLEQAARDASETNRVTEHNWAKAIQKVAENAHAEIETAQRDAADARTAGERLRQQHATTLAALRSAASAAPTDAGSSQAADEAIDLLADMQRRLDEATDTIATFADRAYAAAVAGWAAGEATQ